jgi:hypothetical protein
MSHISIKVIQDEHSSLSAMLKSLRMMIQRGLDNEPLKFFDVMRAMIFYIDEVPENSTTPRNPNCCFQQ